MRPFLLTALVSTIVASPCLLAKTRPPVEWTKERARADTRVNACIERGRFADALKEADSLVAIDGKDARALVQKARALEGLKRTKDAVAAFEAAILADYESCESHLFFATFLMRSGKTGRAETEFKEARRFCGSAQYPTIYRNLAVSAVKQGKRALARKYADEGLEACPGDPYLSGLKGMLIAGESPAEAEALFKSSEAGGESTSDFLVQYGILLINQDRAARAVEVLRKAAGYQPNDRETREYLAVALDRSGKSAEAETILKELLASGGGPETRRRLATVLFHGKKYEEALKQFQSLDKTPENMDRIAMCLFNLGKSDEALAWERKAVAAKPDWPQGMINLAVILGSRAELEEAQSTLKRVLVLEPGNAVVKTDLDRITKALEEYRAKKAAADRQKSLLKSQ